MARPATHSLLSFEVGPAAVSGNFLRAAIAMQDENKQCAVRWMWHESPHIK
jgi:hypothetical protein